MPRVRIDNAPQATTNGGKLGRAEAIAGQLASEYKAIDRRRAAQARGDAQMSFTRVVLSGLSPAGFQRITLTGTAVSSLNSTVRSSAKILDISVETQNARYRADGTAPTATTGVLLVSGATYRLEGFNGTANMKFIAATTGAVLNIQGWKA
jgi:hypothetical protein